MLDANNLHYTDPRTALELDAYAVFCPPAGCAPPPPQSAPAAPTLWSNPSAWPNGRVPIDGDVVVINASSTVILDVSVTARLASLTIYGSLSFLDGVNHTM